MAGEVEAVTVTFAAVAAGTDEVWDVAWPYPGTWLIESLTFMPMTNRTAHDTNFTDMSVNQCTTEIASERTTTGDTGNLVAGTNLTLAITSSGTNLEISEGGRLSFLKTDGGSGVALDGTFMCQARHIRA